MNYLPEKITKETISNINMLFILGRPRSGTTLLNTLLDSHSKILMPFEAYFLRSLVKLVPKKQLLTDIQKGKIIDILYSNNKFPSWPVKKEVLVRNIHSIDFEVNIEMLIKIIYLHYESATPKSEVLIIGDKNPINSLSPDFIFRYFPKAKFIHIVRDYRDNVLSNLKLKIAGRDVYQFAYLWVLSLLRVEKFKTKFPDQFFTLRYEDLSENPEQELKRICTFLNLEYEPEVLGFNELVEEHIQDFFDKDKDKFMRFHNNLLNPVNKSAVGKWKKGLSMKEVQVCEYVAGKFGEKYGYKPSLKKIPALTKAKINFRVFLFKLWLFVRNNFRQLFN